MPVSPLRDHQGTIIGASKIARDITLHKRFQQELAAAKQAADLAKQAAEAANRAKDHFRERPLTRATHPFNTRFGRAYRLEGTAKRSHSTLKH